VAALADDVRRHLADQPVAAGPPTTWYRVRKFVRRNRAALAVILLLLALCGAAVGGVLRMRHVEQQAAEARQKASEVEQKAEEEADATKRDLAASQELGANWRKVNEWEGVRSQFVQVDRWLGDVPAVARPAVQLAPDDRRRLRRAMLEDVLSRVERTPPIPLEPQLSISLLTEVAVRLVAASAYAEFDRPAQGIPHLERAVVIQHYLGSPDSGLTPGIKPSARKVAVLFRVQLLDLRERAGAEAVEKLEAEASELAEILKTGEIRPGTQQALAAIRGALLGRRGEFAAGKWPLLSRYAALTRRHNPASELLGGERTATIRRLVALYEAWGRPDEAADWAALLPAGNQGRKQ
jgi:hypothetical protein